MKANEINVEDIGRILAIYEELIGPKNTFYRGLTPQRVYADIQKSKDDPKLASDLRDGYRTGSKWGWGSKLMFNVGNTLFPINLPVMFDAQLPKYDAHSRRESQEAGEEFHRRIGEYLSGR